MNFLHFELTLNSASIVRVNLSGSEANVRIMDDYNFGQYRARNAHRYFGGHYKRSPALINVPSGGKWHVAVDTGGYSGSVKASVQVI